MREFVSYFFIYQFIINYNKNINVKIDYFEIPNGSNLASLNFLFCLSKRLDNSNTFAFEIIFCTRTHVFKPYLVYIYSVRSKREENLPCKP